MRKPVDRTGGVRPSGVANASPRCGLSSPIVGDVGPEHPLEAPAPVDDNVVQALGADGPHEPFGEGVGAGDTDRGPYPFIEGVTLGGVDS